MITDSRNFNEISGISDISSIFFQFFSDFLANRLSVDNIVSGPVDNRYFGRKNRNFVP